MTTGGLPLKRRRLSDPAHQAPLLGPHNAPPRGNAFDWLTKWSGPTCSQLDFGRGHGRVAIPGAPVLGALNIGARSPRGGGPAKTLLAAGVDALSGNAHAALLASLDSSLSWATLEYEGAGGWVRCGGRVGAWRLAYESSVYTPHPAARPASCVTPAPPQTEVLRELERLPPVRQEAVNGGGRGREADAQQTLCLAVALKLKRSSAFRGVSVQGRRWKARLKKAKKVVFCKMFDTEIEAAKAYDAALTKVWVDTRARALGASAWCLHVHSPHATDTTTHPRIHTRTHQRRASTHPQAHPLARSRTRPRPTCTRAHAHAGCLCLRCVRLGFLGCSQLVRTGLAVP